MTVKSILGWGALAIGLLLVGALAITAVRNRALPTASVDPGRLSAEAQAHLLEAHNLLSELGSRVWPSASTRPGWSDVPIPLIAYNEAYVFLAMPPGANQEPEPGWQRVPDLQHLGNAWEPVAGLTLLGASEGEGAPVYRALLPGGGVTPQGFTVKVGDLWASSLATQTWTRIMLYNQLSGDLPPVLGDVFPYRLAAQLLLQGTDGYELFVVHEAFHAYQGSVAPERLITGEQVQRAQEGRYPWDDEALEAAWQAELDLLAEGMGAASDADALDVASQFLAQRAARRTEAGLDSALVDYERQREWVEGLAKYSELRMWETAYESLRRDPPSYRPVPGLEDDARFRRYRTYPGRYRNEVAQIRRTAGREGDGRFYYSGMAQAYLLDRLAPDWQGRIFDDGVFLEDLLAEAVSEAASRP